MVNLNWFSFVDVYCSIMMLFVVVFSAIDDDHVPFLNNSKFVSLQSRHLEQ